MNCARTGVRVALAALVTAAAAALGCGYALVGRGSTLPPTVRVIRFQTFANETSRVGVEQRVSREVARELATRGRFEVTAGSGPADAELSGAVTQFDLYAELGVPPGGGMLARTLGDRGIRTTADQFRPERFLGRRDVLLDRMEKLFDVDV